MSRINWPCVDTLMTDRYGNKIFNKSIVTGGKGGINDTSTAGEVYYNKNFAAFWVFALNKSYNQPLSCGNWWEVNPPSTQPQSQKDE